MGWMGCLGCRYPSPKSPQIMVQTNEAQTIFKRIAYIYIGTSNYDADRKFYHEILGARLVWEFQEFGARVAAFDLAGEPYLLIADHVHSPSKRLIFEVANPSKPKDELESRGWKP